jgi:tetratricopeptide (TPR) repeat protein
MIEDMRGGDIPTRLLLALLLWAPTLFSQSSVPASVYERAGADLQQGHLAAAEAELRAALKNYPQDAHALGMLGVVLDAEKKYKEAEVYYAESLRLEPRSISLLNNLGNHYLVQGDFTRAREAYLRVVGLEPHHPNANLQLGKMYVAAQQGQRALHYLAALPRTTAGQAGVKLLRAQALHLAGESAEAERLLGEMEKESGNDPRVAFSVGMIEARWREYKEAEQSLRRALAGDPANFDILYNFGLAAFRAGDLDSAQRAFSTALRQRLDSVDTLYGLARVDAAREQNAQAIVLLVKAHHLAPQRPDILVFTGQISEKLGFYGDAVQAFTEYLKLRPHDHVIRRERAFALAHTPQIDEAVQELRDYLRTHPKDARGFLELGISETVRQRNQALKDLDRAIVLDPHMADARLARAVLLYRADQPRRAATDLQFILAREPKNSQALDTMGQVDLQLGQTQEAITLLKQAADLAPTNREILIHYARALQKDRRNQEAMAVLERFQRLPPGRPRPYRGLLDYLSLPAQRQRADYWAHLKAELKMNPEDLSLRAEWAQGQLAQGDTTGALRSFSEILSMNPPAQLLENCGKNLLQYGQYGEARRFFSKAVVADPLGSEPRLDLSIATFHDSGHSAGAQAALAELDQIPPRSRRGDYYLLRAQILDAMGQAQEAANNLTLGLRADPTRPDLYFEAALFLLKHNQGEETAALLRRAVDKFPDSQQLLLTQAITYGLMRQFEKSNQVMSHIEARWPEWGEAYLVHGIILVGQARMREAKPLLETAIALGNRDPFAYYNVALADMEIFPADLPGAAKAIQNALQLNPTDPYTQSLAGKIDYTEKNYSAALEHLNAAIHLWPDMIEARETLSATYRALGERQKSIAQLEAIVRIKQRIRSPDQAPPSDLRSLLFSVPAPVPAGGSS